MINDKRKNDSPNDDIHLMWYCVNATGDRFQDLERSFIEEVIEMNIPVIIVLTKVYNEQGAKEFIEKIQVGSLEKTECILLNATENRSNEKEDLIKLVELTSELLPESIQCAFANSQYASVMLKSKVARKIIIKKFITSFSKGYYPKLKINHKIIKQIH